MNRDRLLETLKRHEGFRSHPYQDTVGKWTIGYGRNLDDVGLSVEEASALLWKDILKAEGQARSQFGWFEGLTEERQEVVVNMIFNLGISRFKGFAKTIAAIKAGDYETAAAEMLDSKWAKQVGKRAEELAAAMRGA